MAEGYDLDSVCLGLHPVCQGTPPRAVPAHGPCAPPQDVGDAESQDELRAHHTHDGSHRQAVTVCTQRARGVPALGRASPREVT